ncbi:hypothetical protein RRG08_037042 [Elysia crispata]|uniref:protein-tyrosine-phosphatase n=1 Tax=Elysia crispata TaxID=231223 RepID=A0AAE0YAY0_9GAST|nr:hypothetical protein RRG08_037042 [Elysia crispata]
MPSFHNSKQIFKLVLVLLAAVPGCLASVCYTVRGEIFSCDYHCHCLRDAKCDRNTGACAQGCSSPYFGPACQYKKRDLETSSGPAWLTDNNDNTCNDGNTESVGVAVKISHPLTWMRLVFSSEEYHNISLSYKTDGPAVEEQCSELQMAKVDGTTVDISCPTTERVKYVRLSGLSIKSLCSLYINTGRNVALNQNATQSSMYNNWLASQAVDGFREGERDVSDTCSHTESESQGWWFLSFHQPVEVNSVVLYNREDFEYRLAGFVLQLINREMETFFSYQDKQDPQSLYYIIPSLKPKQAAYHMEITQGPESRFVTLCEVIVFGDTVCPAGKFGRDCEHQCNCADQTNSCFVHSGGCPSGCAPGYTGEDCKTECPRGRFGVNCIKTCSDHCLGEEKLCDPADGACNTGCDLGYHPPLCVDECPEGRFGSSCKHRCSLHCEGQGNACDSKNGSCEMGCEPGYISPMCIDECPEGYFGLNCVDNCSSHCEGEDNPCNPRNGSCDLGCELGYSPPLCVDKCPGATYGKNCGKSCSTRCLNSSCHHMTGRCYQCQAGYRGDFCDLECSTNMYGDGCQMTCDANCLNLMCHHVTGKCHQCVPGKEGEFCQKVVNKGGNNLKELIGITVGVVVVLVIIIIISGAVLIVYLCRHRNKCKRRETAELQGTQPGMRAGVELSIIDKYRKSARQRRSKGQVHKEAEEKGPAEEMYMNIQPNSPAVRVEDLRAYILQHATGSFLKKQYESVPLESKYSRLNAHDPCNAKKNRYKNILPDDYSRVCLKVYDDYEDYINASHIKDYNNKKVYIAAQAPNDCTTNDFVRMLWEQEIDRIIMLTKLVEGKKVKSVRYWPQEGQKVYYDINMQLVSTQVYAEYTVRRLKLSKSGSSEREVIQFHFTTWPDKSVPESPWGLVDLYHRVMADPGAGPLLVHCSAGVGRTGTFIALCILLQEAEATGKMDFRSTLWKLRQQRMSMIQTIEQYVFLHKLALAAHLTAGTRVPAADIPHHIQALNDGHSGDSSTSSSLDGYTKEFKAVCEICSNGADGLTMETWVGDNIYQNRKSAANKDKNRVKNILPNDAYRPVLTSETISQGKYINAVLVPNLATDRQDILTQLPLPSTVTDFWRLVTQFNVDLIVAFDTDCRNSDETVGSFLPERDPIKTDLFEIQAELRAETSSCHEILVTVFKKRRSILSGAGEHHVMCLLCKTPGSDPKVLLDIHRRIKYWRPDLPQRTLFTCRNGADHCGLMCVQSILLDRLDVDKALSVPVVVGAIKTIRPQVIPSVDQYRCLYSVLKLAQDSQVAKHTSKTTTAADFTGVDSVETIYCNVKIAECMITTEETKPKQTAYSLNQDLFDGDPAPSTHHENQENESKVHKTNYTAQSIGPEAQVINQDTHSSNTGAEYSHLEAQNSSAGAEYSSFVAQNSDAGAEYPNSLAQKLNAEAEYSKFEGQNLNAGAEYSNFVVQNPDAGAEYPNSVAKELNGEAKYSKSEVQNLNAGAEYSNFVAPNFDAEAEYPDSLAQKSNGETECSKFEGQTPDAEVEYSNFASLHLQF